MTQTPNQSARSVAYHDNQEKLAFYVAANDRDMLGKINQLLARNGCVGFTDTAGRVHYLIDGRRGVPYASRRILETTGQILRDRQQQDSETWKYFYQVVDRTLATHGIRSKLNGYHYLRCILLAAGLGETQIRPVSKTVYPLVAEQYKVRVSQIERDIRYALKGSDLYRQGLTPTASICRLHLEAVRAVEQEQHRYLACEQQPECKEKPFSMTVSSEGSHVTY